MSAIGPQHAWAAFEPPGGWSSFGPNQALVAAIWAGLDERGGQWHYMNLTSESSVWESCVDGSAIEMWHEPGGGQRLVELRVSSGVAAAYMAPIAEAFGLVASAC